MPLFFYLLCTLIPYTHPIPSFYTLILLFTLSYQMVEDKELRIHEMGKEV